MSFNSRGCVAVARKKANKNPNGGANPGFEQTLWAAADKLRAANIELLSNLVFNKLIQAAT